MTSSASFPTVADFVATSAFTGDAAGINRLAIGNPAGDADSIVSAIGSAYVDTILRGRLTVPVLSIPLDDLQALRPESKYLLSIAGVTNLNSIVSIADMHDLPEKARVTLVDHNQLLSSPVSKEWEVEAILDHHQDEGEHTNTCVDRDVAFDTESSQALVASTCTLIVERWQRFAVPGSAMPATLAILLLGVILIDSINLSPKAKKVTPRDENAVKFLQESTDWSQLSLPAEVSQEDGSIPDHTKLFETLQRQKFQESFWCGLTASQALQLDYKTFSVGNQTFGVASVLQSMSDFLKKENIYQSLLDDHFPECDFSAIMFLKLIDDVPHRQLVLASPNENLIRDLLDYLDGNELLQPTVVGRSCDSLTNIQMVQIEQGNTKASRKQVAPILMDFYRSRGVSQ